MNEQFINGFQFELEKQALKGALIGAGVGALGGAGIGAISAKKGKRLKGAAIGAGIGAPVGALWGHGIQAIVKQIRVNMKDVEAFSKQHKNIRKNIRKKRDIELDRLHSINAKKHGNKFNNMLKDIDKAIEKFKLNVSKLKPISITPEKVRDATDKVVKKRYYKIIA